MKQIFAGFGQACAGLILVCAIATTASLELTGCKGRAKEAQAPTTNVERGELFQTGSAIYDEYFKSVHELNTLVANGRLEERDARTSLAQMLHLLPTAEPEQILRKLGETLKTSPKLEMTIGEKEASHAVTVKLEDGSRPESEIAPFVKTLEVTASAELSLSARMGEVPERSRRVQQVGQTLLEGVANDFAKAPREQRDQIAQELQASSRVLEQIGDEARSISARTRVFVQDMKAAMDANSAEAPETKPDKPTKSKGKPGKASKSAEPPRNPPAATAAPPKSDDFNP